MKRSEENWTECNIPSRCCSFCSWECFCALLMSCFIYIFLCVCVCVSRLPSKLWLQLIVALSLLLHRSVDLQPVMFWIFLQQTNIQFLNVPSCKENSQYAWQMAKIHNCVLLHHCYKHSHIHPLQPPSRSWLQSSIFLLPVLILDAEGEELWTDKPKKRVASHVFL